jgi:hypothetical protein
MGARETVNRVQDTAKMGTLRWLQLIIFCLIHLRKFVAVEIVFLLPSCGGQFPPATAAREPVVLTRDVVWVLRPFPRPDVGGTIPLLEVTYICCDNSKLLHQR